MAGHDREYLIAIVHEQMWRRTQAMNFAAETSQRELMDLSGESLLSQMDLVRKRLQEATAAVAKGDRQPVMDLQDDLKNLAAETAFLLLATNQITSDIEEPDLDL